ncbi:hypothetical protein [Pararhodobacter zhoushanensis]|uniref:Uncharacterized protein n=1 Tax=Pararhodobacter zhoushanensis TaxID=2479545 RepID=A0ABT3H2A1_9RHOB|nr:hypothetical protein [Pararhodobacter zhoushanensis]MCW1933823.1 hypothetical protein [Pararhodobacter zhoushanensis]
MIEDIRQKEMALMTLIAADFEDDDIATALRVIEAVTAKLKQMRDEQP